MIGRIQRVKIKEIWKQEGDFTKWLQDNIDILNKVINLPLSSPEKEKQEGSFLVDLVDVAEDGNPVVIDNKLKKATMSI